jgi:uncharacterized membrane protein YqjE
MAQSARGGGAPHAAAAQAAASRETWVRAPLAARDPGLSREASLGAALRGVWVELRSMVREHAVLAVLEAQRAGLHLAYLLAGVLVVSVLAVTAWLAGITALVVWMVDNDVPWPGVLLLAAVLNLIGAAFIAFWVKRQVSELPFTATLRQFSADREEISTGGSHAQAARP